MSRQAGFTLVEVLIATAVLALSMAAVIGTAGHSARLGAQLRDDTFADWVAMNELATLRLAQQWPAGDSLDGDADMGGESWHWVATFTKTTDPALLRVDISVSHAATPDAAVTSLTGFMGQPR